MRTRILVTNGTGQFHETAWDKPDINDAEIEVRAVLTGICRSDIDMMNGEFGPLPIHMQGHEGLGQVIRVGANIAGVKVGDYVATRGEPAYADYYNVRENEFVVVPEAAPKYILEPVACGVNLVTQSLVNVRELSGEGKRLLLIGSGFLAWCAYHTIKSLRLNFEIDVVGSSNYAMWSTLPGKPLRPMASGKYDVVIDIGPRKEIFTDDILNNEALVILGTQKSVTTDFSNLLWKAVTMVFPSPRTAKFIYAMQHASHLVETGQLNVDKFWTRSYNRDTEWQAAFNDGNNRPKDYSRGYISWL
jgi:threonine dehydrogenase-like Zn-dependent dehydrogenase